VNGSPRNLGNAEFLQAVFGAGWRDAHVTGFFADPTNASPSDWAGSPWRLWPSDGLARLSALNAYFSISLFAGNRRVKAEFRSCHAIVLDDVGKKVDARDALATLGDPSWRLETSSGNEQWGYLLSVPETDPRKVEALLKALAVKGLTDPASIDVTRYMRLPCGVNTKGGIARSAALKEWEPTRKFAIDELLRLAGALEGYSSTWPPVPGTGPGSVGPLRGTGTGTSGRKWLSQADLASGGPIIRTLDRWGDLTGTKTNDGGWHLFACPWDASHTPGAKVDDRTAVYPGGGFKCWHGHCAARNRADFLDWFNRKLDDESGGLFSDAAQLDMEVVDPASIAVPGVKSGTIAAPIAVSPTREASRRFLREMIWVRGQGKFYSRRSHQLETRESLDGTFRLPMRDLLLGEKREIKASDWFFANPYRIAVDNLVYWPGGADVLELEGVSYANRWRPCVLGRDLAQGTAIPNWMVKTWLDLVFHVLGNEGPKFVVRVLDWMAMVVADPGTKPGWHLIVQGAQGIGKDLLMLPIVFAVGAANVGTVSAQGLHGQFNAWAEKRLILVSELKQTSHGSASGRDQYHTLKALTENTSPTVPINEKNVKEYRAKNVGAYYVVSNEPDALALDDDDRRFMVAASTAVKWPRARYAALLAWLGGPVGHGTETVAGWLRQRWARMPVARRAFLLGNAPESQSKRDMVTASDPVRAWTQTQIEDGDWPDLMTSGEIEDRYRLAVRNRVFKFAVPAGRWGRVLTALGGGKVYGGNQVRLPDGRRVRMWAVRGVSRFTNMGAPQIAQAYKSAATLAFGSNTEVVVLPYSASDTKGSADSETET
jgi:hypothetical protein